MPHQNITITGKVQGVYFRAATRDKALELGVTGRVANRPDGSVFVEAEGSAEQLALLLAWLHRGPPAARVDAVDAQQGELCGYSDFVILR